MIYSYQSNKMGIIKDIYPEKVLIVPGDLTPNIQKILNGEYSKDPRRPVFELRFILYNHLLSHLSEIPMYVTRSDDGSKQIYDRRNEKYVTNPSQRIFMGPCNNLPPRKIIDLANFLKIDTSSGNHYIICEAIDRYLDSIGHAHYIP